MPRRPRHAPLAVWLNGRLVGKLMRQADGGISFAYDRIWLDWEHAQPISLSLPLREERFLGAVVTAVFENLLPDATRIRERLAGRLRAEGTDPYSLLAAAGRDCVGALQFLDANEDPGPAGAVAGAYLTDEEIGQILDLLPEAPLGNEIEGDFRISIAGAQDKTALLRVDGRWMRPSGTAATTHIIKPPIGKARNSKLDLSDSVENEFFSLTLLRHLGLEAARAEIVDFAGRRALAVERFDRYWTDEPSPRLIRLPQEDLLQALGRPSASKYENDGGPGIVEIMNLLRSSDRPALDRRAFFEAQIAFWLIAAPDGHAKNFSLALLPGGRFHMTPLYDVMSAEPNVARGELETRKLKLAMAVGDNRHYRMDEIVPRHFRQTAKVCGFAEIDSVLEELKSRMDRAIDAALAETAGKVPARVSEPMVRGMRKRGAR
ncbi:MAG: type II toxin-antitoxin system HipA family toxin [Alphaproteobacteria bacterium]|nr:type II toxin-antitoxin system HipA family toxin [Alphaproteobacteria bacterium]